MSKDLNRFLLSKSISSSLQDSYAKSFRKKRNSQFLLDGNGMSIDIFSKLVEDRIIFLYDEVDDNVCNIIKAQLLYLEMQSSEDISLYLDTGGGSVYSGLGLIDVMDYVKPDIVTINTGLAASMGAVILCSGAEGKRKALKRSRTMIHQPMTGFGSYVQASDIEIEAKEINSVKRELYEIISTSTGQKYEKVHLDSDRDYWMTALEAKDYGMIDHIVTSR